MSQRPRTVPRAVVGGTLGLLALLLVPAAATADAVPKLPVELTLSADWQAFTAADESVLAFEHTGDDVRIRLLALDGGRCEKLDRNGAEVVAIWVEQFLAQQPQIQTLEQERRSLDGVEGDWALLRFRSETGDRVGFFFAFSSASLPKPGACDRFAYFLLGEGPDTERTRSLFDEAVSAFRAQNTAPKPPASE